MLNKLKKEMSKRLNPFDEEREKDVLKREIKQELRDVIDEYKTEDKDC